MMPRVVKTGSTDKWPFIGVKFVICVLRDDVGNGKKRESKAGKSVKIMKVYLV